MKWKAQDSAEAGDTLRLLAKQGEPLFKKLDEGAKVELLKIQAREAAILHAKRTKYYDSELAMAD